MVEKGEVTGTEYTTLIKKLKDCSSYAGKFGSDMMHSACNAKVSFYL